MSYKYFQTIHYKSSAVPLSSLPCGLVHSIFFPSQNVRRVPVGAPVIIFLLLADNEGQLINLSFNSPVSHL